MSETLPAEPPPEAVLQEDGSYVQEHEGGVIVRWTQRPDGTWRKPERKRQGWIGALEQTRYVAPPTRTPRQDNDREGKHGLHRPWRVWLRQLQVNAPGAKKKDKPPPDPNGAGFTEEIECIHEFDTAEDFWCMVHHTKSVSNFENCDISLFETGVIPAWEDPRFKKGGRWILKLDKIKARNLDDLWLMVSMALIGEDFADIGGETIRGATVSLRSRVTKIGLWLESARDKEAVMAIGKHYRKVLSDHPELHDIGLKELEFEDFDKKDITFQLYRVKDAAKRKEESDKRKESKREKERCDRDKESSASPSPTSPPGKTMGIFQ